LIDARRGIKDVDHEVMKLLDSAAVSYVVTLTKIDTLKPAEREKAIAQVKAQMAGHVAAYPDILVTSAESGEGMEEIRQQLTALVTS
jgi:GTP-binding protein